MSKETESLLLRQQYRDEILARLKKSRLIVLPCYFLSLVYFLYLDINTSHFMPAAYARLFPLTVVVIFGTVCLLPKWYRRWGYQLHHLCLFSVMAMMTFILSQSVEKSFYNSAITALIMVILIVLVEERGGLRATIPIYLIPMLSLFAYFFWVELPTLKATSLSNPIMFTITSLIYSKVQEGFRWRDFLNMKTIEQQQIQTENLYKDVLVKNTEIAQQKDEITSQNGELTQLNEELTVLLETVEQQNKAIQQQNSKITSSITYAKRLQTAILPYEQKIEQAFGNENYFILYKPKDIVSGDFYWLYTDNEQTILAVVDCTGHGVPGAFMSVIGCQLLAEIIEQRHIFQPDKVLNELHKQIRRILKQDQSDNRDGMDLLLIRWQKASQLLQFSGAMNPLFLHDSLVAENGLIEIKADKKPIGGHQAEDERIFTLHEINIIAPTTLYLCTDGYQDQFGGAKSKKFMVRQLKELLVSIAKEPMLAQKEILNQKIEDWSIEGAESQVDDITIIGIRL